MLTVTKKKLTDSCKRAKILADNRKCHHPIDTLLQGSFVAVYFSTQSLQVDSHLRAENFTNTCQRARFREHCHDCRRNFTSLVAVPCEGRARNGSEITLVSSYKHMKNVFPACGGGEKGYSVNRRKLLTW